MFFYLWLHLGGQLPERFSTRAYRAGGFPVILGQRA
jgi:hypothetical protein